MIRSLESRPFGEPRISVKWQLSAGDGLLKFCLLFGYTVRSREPFLSLGYPCFDIFGGVQRYVGSLNDDGLSRNRLGPVVGGGRGDEVFYMNIRAL